jgi:hypothetical protein
MQKAPWTRAFSVELLGAISNQQLQARLRQLSDKLDRLAASDAKPRRSGRTDYRLRSGAIFKAILSVLSSADRPMRTREIHKAVMALLEQPVGYSSVKARLADKAHGEDACFERVARGCYRLKSPS